MKTYTQLLENFCQRTDEHVRFNDLDLFGHVNNARYLSYLEEARISYIEAAIDFDRRSLAFDSIVARIDISYMLPIEYGDTLQLWTRCQHIGTKSMELQTLIFKQSQASDEPKLAAQAVVTLVAFDLETSQSRVVDAEYIRKLELYEGRKLQKS